MELGYRLTLGIDFLAAGRRVSTREMPPGSGAMHLERDFRNATVDERKG